MNTIKRDVYVLRNTIKIPIEVTKGTDMVGIEFTVRDFDIPATAAAVAYSYNRKMKKPNSQLCDVKGNVISFTPGREFFEVGMNELQIRVINEDKALISFKEKVKCSDAMGFPDDEEEKQQTLIEQLLSNSGKETGERKKADETERNERTAAIEKEKNERTQADATEKSERKAEIDVERKRIDNLAKLPAGSTTGDAELKDIRVGADGTIYGNAGEAVRQQVGSLKEDLVNQFDITGWNIIPIHNFEMKMLERDGNGISNYSPLFEKAIHSNFVNFGCDKIRISIKTGYSGRLHEFSSNSLGTQTFYKNINAGITDIEVDSSKYYVFDFVHGPEMEDNANWQVMTTDEHVNLRVFKIHDKLKSFEDIVAIGSNNIATKTELQNEHSEMNVRFSNELDIGGYSSVYVRDWGIGSIKRDGSALDNYEFAKNKAIHSGFFKLRDKVRFILSDGYQARLHCFASNSFGTQEYYENITDTVDIELDPTKQYALDLVSGEVENIVGSSDISIDEFNNIKIYNITDKIKKIDELIDDFARNKYNTRGKIYGIRIDNSTGNVTRIADAIGLSNDYVVGDKFELNNGINDFDNIFPWCDMKLCNVKVENGIKIITYANKESFTTNGTNGDVMVEIPKFYSMRTILGDIEEICISGERKSGFELEPAFFDSETGKEINFIYCGVYLTNIENGKHTSKTGTFPTVSKSLLEFRSCGEMYDFAMVQALQKLISIEFGAINLSRYMGGLSYLIYPSDAKAYESVTNSNTGIFYSGDNGGSANIDNLFVGCNIAVGDTIGSPVDRKVISLGDVTVYTDTNGKKWHRRSVTFDGDAISITKDTTFIYCGPNNNGLSDNMIYHTGRKGLTQSSVADQFKYRNIEGLWGNVGEIMDGVRLKNLNYYFSYIKKDYSDISKYYKLSYSSVEQNQYDFYKSFILKMGYDRRYPSVNLPCKISWDGSGDTDKYYGDILCANYLTGADGESFPEGTEFVSISSMAWDGNDRNGLYTVRFWNTETSKSGLYGTRMIYRNL